MKYRATTTNSARIGETRSEAVDPRLFVLGDNGIATVSEGARPVMTERLFELGIGDKWDPSGELDLGCGRHLGGDMPGCPASPE